MYGPLWRVLPGPWPAKVMFLIAMALVVVYCCFTWLFPYVSELLPMNDANVHTGALGGASSVAQWSVSTGA